MLGKAFSKAKELTSKGLSKSKEYAKDKVHEQKRKIAVDVINSTDNKVKTKQEHLHLDRARQIVATKFNDGGGVGVYEIPKNVLRAYDRWNDPKIMPNFLGSEKEILNGFAHKLKADGKIKNITSGGHAYVEALRWLDENKSIMKTGGGVGDDKEIKSIEDALDDYYGIDESSKSITSADLEKVLLHNQYQTLKYKGKYIKTSHRGIPKFNEIKAKLKSKGWVIYEKQKMSEGGATKGFNYSIGGL